MRDFKRLLTTHQSQNHTIYFLILLQKSLTWFLENLTNHPRMVMKDLKFHRF